MYRSSWRLIHGQGSGIRRVRAGPLDDFGVLVDGVDQVKRDFDAIKGKGAFDQLGPAAQKAEIVRAAIADMNRQMGMIGVKGDELVFKLGRIKTKFAEIATKAGTALLPVADALSDTLDRIGGGVDNVVQNFAEAVTRNYATIKTMFASCGLRQSRGCEMDAPTQQPVKQLVLTCEQVAEMLQVPVETVKNLHRTRQLPGVMVGKHLRFIPGMVEAYVAGLQPVAQ